MKIKIPHKHMVMVHMDCGGVVDAGEQYYDWFAEDVGEHQYCHGCDDYLSLKAWVVYMPRRRMLRLQAAYKAEAERS